MTNPSLEKVAATQYMWRNMLISVLKESILDPTLAKKITPGCQTMLDVWDQQFHGKFFDMGTLIRAATSVETGLRDYYMTKKGHKNLIDLKNDPDYSQNIFQRILPWNGLQANGGITLMKKIGADLESIPNFVKIQELILDRHLYAHNAGVVDDEYIQKLQKLTGQDILPIVTLEKYPMEDVYWFFPLSDKSISEFIEAARILFQNLH